MYYLDAYESLLIDIKDKRARNSKYKYSRDYDMIKNLKNGVYINELGEESFLSESSVENRLKSFKPSDTTTTKKMFTLNHEDPKLTKRVTKISLPNAKIKKSKTNKSSFLAYSKRMSKYF